MEGSRKVGVALVVCALLTVYGCGGGQGEFTGGTQTPSLSCSVFGVNCTPTPTPGVSGALGAATTISSVSFQAGSQPIELIMFDEAGNCIINATSQISVLAGDVRGHPVAGVPIAFFIAQGRGVIDAQATTNAAGVATATFQSLCPRDDSGRFIRTPITVVAAVRGAEPFTDSVISNGKFDPGEPFIDLPREAFLDANQNGVYEPDQGEYLIWDPNHNGQFDPGGNCECPATNVVPCQGNCQYDTDNIITSAATILPSMASMAGTPTVIAEGTPTPPLPPFSIQFVSAQPAQIGIRQSGLTDQSVLTFKVTDANAAPLANVPVTFSVSGTDEETVNPTQANTDTMGLARTTLSSGTLATTVRVFARADSNGDGTLDLSADTTVSIFGGPAVRSGLTIAAEHLNVAGRLRLLQDAITFSAHDRFGNAVPPGTSVNFVSNGGGVVAPTTTDDKGFIAATLVTGQPIPPTGIVTILAITRGEEEFQDNNGNHIFDSQCADGSACTTESDCASHGGGPCISRCPDGSACPLTGNGAGDCATHGGGACDVPSQEDRPEPFIDFRPLPVFLAAAGPNDANCSIAAGPNDGTPLCNNRFDPGLPFEQFFDQPPKNGVWDIKPADAVWDNNIVIFESIPITFSGPTAVPVVTNLSTGERCVAGVDCFAIPDGGSNDFSVEIHDDLFNPLVAGSVVNITVDGGLVTPSQFTIGDGESFNQLQDGLTRFAFRVSDLVPADFKPKATAIDIEVTSDNGDRSALFNGRIDIAGDTPTATGVSGPTPTPVPLAVVPSPVTLEAGTGAAPDACNGGIQQFTVTGGAPPYRIAATGGCVSVTQLNASGGQFTYQAGNQSGIFAITVTDTLTVVARVVVTIPAGPPTPTLTGTLGPSPSPTPTETPNLPAAAIQFVGADPAFIGVRQSGQPEQSVLTFEVTNVDDKPVFDAAVTFTLSGIGDETITPIHAITDRAGLVTTTLHSGIRATTVQVVATVDGAPGISAQSIPVSVVGAPPVRNRFSVAPQGSDAQPTQKVNVPGRISFGIENRIKAFVNDRFGNAAPPGTAVSFETNGASVVEPTITVANGEATAVLVTEENVPPSGIVTILAYTRGEEEFADNNGNGIFDAQCSDGTVCTVESDCDSHGGTCIARCPDGSACGITGDCTNRGGGSCDVPSQQDLPEPFIDFRPLPAMVTVGTPNTPSFRVLGTFSPPNDAICTLLSGENAGNPLCNGLFDVNLPFERFVDLPPKNGTWDIKPADDKWDRNVVIFDTTTVTFSGRTVTPRVTNVTDPEHPIPCTNDAGVLVDSCFAIPNGGSATFTVELHDDLFNPVVQGSRMTIGTLVATVVAGGNTVIRDGESFNQIVDNLTRFTFVLADANPQAIGPLTTDLIRVTVLSTNGDFDIVAGQGTVD
jgi:Big-like domain-containing protein